MTRVPIGFSGFGIALFRSQDSVLNVRTGCGTPKISIGITGISENFCRDEGIEEHYWGPSVTGQKLGHVVRFYLVHFCTVLFLSSSAQRSRYIGEREPD